MRSETRREATSWFRRAFAPRLGGSGGSGQLFIHFGMLLATLAFASWWTSHTILDTARTRKATDAVLENAIFRHSSRERSRRS